MFNLITHSWLDFLHTNTPKPTHQSISLVIFSNSNFFLLVHYIWLHSRKLLLAVMCDSYRCAFAALANGKQDAD